MPVPARMALPWLTRLRMLPTTKAIRSEFLTILPEQATWKSDLINGSDGVRLQSPVTPGRAWRQRWQSPFFESIRSRHRVPGRRVVLDGPWELQPDSDQAL